MNSRFFLSIFNVSGSIFSSLYFIIGSLFLLTHLTPEKAEAFFHEDSLFRTQMMEMSKIIDDKTLENTVLSEKLEDLSGNPISWNTAINNLQNQHIQKPVPL